MALEQADYLDCLKQEHLFYALYSSDEVVSIGRPDLIVEIPEDDIYRDEIVTAVREACGTLGEKEYEVLSYRYGLDSKPFKTLREISDLFGVTPTRIRQIESRAMRKLRHPIRSKQLRMYL